jgi:hypothetical protein
MDEEALDRRRQLWRDTALLLSVLLVVLAGANLILPGLAGAPGASPTPIPTGVVTGGSSAEPSPAGPPPSAAAPGATPHSGPKITQPPTGTAPPTHPGTTPRPTVRPRPTPTSVPSTPRPTPAPTPAPTPTPTPDPIAHVTCDAPIGLTVTCTSSSTHELVGSEVWNMGGPGVLVSGGDGSETITWTYDDVLGSPYTVTLTVTGLDGVTTASDTTQVAL